MRLHLLHLLLQPEAIADGAAVAGMLGLAIGTHRRVEGDPRHTQQQRLFNVDDSDPLHMRR